MVTLVAETFAGQLIAGAVLSTLLTLNVQVVVLPEASVAVMVTVCVPVPESMVPAAGLCVMVGVPQLSVAVVCDT